MKIILLHGLYMHGIVMQPLSFQLRKLGYDTQVISYNSLNIDEEALFTRIDQALAQTSCNILVGHSLGGLMIKRYLNARNPSTEVISHVVAIGSPLKGASIVSRLQHLGVGKVLGNSPQCGLQQHEDTWHFPQALGSIAGNIPFGVRRLLIRDNSQSDGTVTLDETRLWGMKDHIETKQTHTSLIYNAFVPAQIDHFIRNNQFLR
ncbi:cob(I)alamin adenolsyltransferase [Shewanella holmiensis]|uniref:Cob(I)alamin adenolsyltransferase n=1 Tax=Shewanella holmiensis TaxID=2952222 RepID=A0A9X3ATC3_9GAMM|nr:cob(I)alamin adenolsyltransferase [Shewanella holmiensis]MCT7940370.1 cob(I)alamin adenolsyltransferase [Shewanella holmiensis]